MIEWRVKLHLPHASLKGSGAPPPCCCGCYGDVKCLRSQCAPLPSEFFERTILCNSLVWSCALTGRAGLTYLEAVESERRARQSLQSFPTSLLVPLLHLAAVSRCSRLSDLCEDVYLFIKNRFFPGEAVEVTARDGAR